MDEDNILERIEEAAAATPFVVIDLEGTAAKIVLLAVSQPDLVIAPMQGSHLDAEQANRAIRVLKQHEKMTGRAVPFGVLLTRTSQIICTRTMGHIQTGLEEAHVPVFGTQLKALDAREVPNLVQAIADAEQFTAEVFARSCDARAPATTEAAR